MSEESKLEFNKRSIGKRVYCTKPPGFYALIIDVKDELTFVVRDDFGKEALVEVFDVRYY
jgi:hypothetical protein